MSATARIMLDVTPPRLLVLDELGDVLAEHPEPDLTVNRADALLIQSGTPRRPGTEWDAEYDLEDDTDRMTLVGYTASVITAADFGRTTA